MAILSVPTRRSASLLTVYALLIAAAVVAFAVIQHIGAGLTAPEPMTATGAAGTAHLASVNVVLHVLTTLAAIIALGNLFAWGFRRSSQRRAWPARPSGCSHKMAPGSPGGRWSWRYNSTAS